MPTRYIVAEGQEFSYPANTESLKIIEKAGGRSKLSEEDVKRVKYKTVKVGDDCGDIPTSALNLYLERGWIVDLSAKKSELKEIKEVAAEEEEDNNG